jgi:hypothetical protein
MYDPAGVGNFYLVHVFYKHMTPPESGIQVPHSFLPPPPEGSDVYRLSGMVKISTPAGSHVHRNGDFRLDSDPGGVECKMTAPGIIFFISAAEFRTKLQGEYTTPLGSGISILFMFSINI